MTCMNQREEETFYSNAHFTLTFSFTFSTIQSKVVKALNTVANSRQPQKMGHNNEKNTIFTEENNAHRLYWLRRHNNLLELQSVAV